MGKRGRDENDEEKYFPIFKKANVVGRVLQQLDSNVPKAAAPPKTPVPESKKSESLSVSKPTSSGFATVLRSLGKIM